MKPMNKFNAQKTEINWVKFASKIEANVYSFLLSEGVEILELQPKFELQEKYRHEWEAIRAINYVSDFRVLYNWHEFIVEVKGMQTPEWKLKKKMFHKKFPHEKLIVVKSLKEMKSILVGKFWQKRESEYNE